MSGSEMGIKPTGNKKRGGAYISQKGGLMSDNNEPVYSDISMLKGCSGTGGYDVQDLGCPCRCLWLVGYDGNYVNDATSCPPGGYVQSWDPENPGYYSCQVIADCNCNNPSFSAPGSIFTQLDPMIGNCNGAPMMCGVCIDGQCTYSSIYG